MKQWLEAIESESIEEGFERFSTEDMLKIFLKSGIKICYDLGISFWYEDLDWFTYDKLTEDEIDSIYNSACVEREVWMKNDHRAEADEAISLVIHSIEALRGDIKAAIIATSKIGIFSQYDWSEYIINKNKQRQRDGGKQNKHKRNQLIFSIYIGNVKGKKYSGSRGEAVLKFVNEMLRKSKHEQYHPLLKEIKEDEKLNGKTISRIIGDVERQIKKQEIRDNK